MPEKWWEKARERVGRRDPADRADYDLPTGTDDWDPAGGLDRSRAFDDAMADLRDGDPAAAQELVHGRGQDAMARRPGADNYQALAEDHTERAREGVHEAHVNPPGGDPNHPFFHQMQQVNEREGVLFRQENPNPSYRRVDDPALAGRGHVHGEYGVLHAHPGGELAHTHPEAVFEQAGFEKPGFNPAPAEPEPFGQAVAEAANPFQAVVEGATVGAVSAAPLVTTPVGAMAILAGGAIGAGVAGVGHLWRRLRGRSRDQGSSSANVVAGALPVALVAAALLVPNNPDAYQFADPFADPLGAIGVENFAPCVDRPDRPCPGRSQTASRGWNPIAEAAKRTALGVTLTGQSCVLGQAGPTRCYHKDADGNPDLGRGPSNESTRGGDLFGLDADGNPCLLGRPGCRAAEEAAGGLGLGPAAERGPALGRTPDGRGCFIGPDNPDCRAVGAEPPAALPGLAPPGELPPVEPIEPLEPLPIGEMPWLNDCPEDDPEQCAGFRFEPLRGFDDPFDPFGRGGLAEGDWQGRGWNNPGNLAEFGVKIPPSYARGCDMGGGKPCTPMSLSAFKRGIQAMGLADGGPIVLCPTLGGFRHTPSHPVLQTQARAGGQTADQVELFVRTHPGFWVSWSTNQHGRLEFTVIEDPVEAVSVRKVLTPATIRWINQGEVQQRFPGKQAQVPDVCFVDNLRPGEPLHAWHPADPGVHQISEVQLMTHWGVTASLDERSGNYDPYEFEVALGVASPDR